MKRDRMKPRNTSKCAVSVEDRHGSRIVRKDCRGIKSRLVRRYVSMTLRNEHRAYTRLAGLPGIPPSCCITGEGCLELAFVPGRHLGLFKRRSVPEEVFDRLSGIVRAMHERGVANTDLHRSNVLVADDGSVHIIDFAHALIAANPRRPGMLVRLAMKLDWYAVARMKARYAGVRTPAPAGLFGILYRSLKAVKRLMRVLKGKHSWGSAFGRRT